MARLLARNDLRDQLAPVVAESVYYGFWYAAKLDALFAFIREAQKPVTGEVTLTTTGAAPRTYRAGETFFVPKGFKGYWRQSEPMLKYYVIIE